MSKLQIILSLLFLLLFVAIIYNGVKINKVATRGGPFWRFENVSYSSLNREQKRKIRKYRNYLIMTFIFFILIAFLSFIFFGDKSKENINLESSDKKIKSVQIFCWCFSNMKSQNGLKTVFDDCTTPIAIKPDVLITSKNFFYFSDSLDKIDALRKTLNNFETIDSSQIYPPDSRFLILFNYYNRPMSDTFVYVSGVEFYHDRQYYHYPFNVMDSIRNFMNAEIIRCSSD